MVTNKVAWTQKLTKTIETLEENQVRNIFTYTTVKNAMNVGDLPSQPFSGFASCALSGKESMEGGLSERRR